MAASIQVLMAAGSIPRTPSSPSLRRRPIRALCAFNNKDAARRIAADPNDPFLRRLSWASENFPETLSSRSDTLPFRAFLDPKLIAGNPSVPAPGYKQKKDKPAPPDISTAILEKRVVYIGLPLVNWVVERAYLEMLYLQSTDPREPIFLYINSSGTTGEDGVPLAPDSGGFALHDLMMRSKGEVHTLCCGAAMGHACLLLAAGTKGKRYMMTHGRAAIQQTRMPPSGLLNAVHVLSESKKAKFYNDKFVELMAKHTGNSEEAVANKMRSVFYMNASGAKEFGVIDEIVGMKEPEDDE